jgi:molybdopterin-binding protein
MTMQISACNVLKGKVVKLVEGAVNCEVTLEIAPRVEIVSIITKASAVSLGLKASSVMIAID